MSFEIESVYKYDNGKVGENIHQTINAHRAQLKVIGRKQESPQMTDGTKMKINYRLLQSTLVPPPPNEKKDAHAQTSAVNFPAVGQIPPTEIKSPTTSELRCEMLN